MKVTNFSILIGVNNLIKSKEIYENIFGMQFVELRPPFAQANLNGLEFNIEENTDYRDKDWSDKNIGNRKSISFEVDNIEEMKIKVLENNCKIIKDIEIMPWGYKEMIFADIDNNEFMIEQKI